MYVLTINQSYQTRSTEKTLHISCRIKHFANSFFLYTIKELSNLSSLLNFIRPNPNGLLNVSDSLGIKLFTILRLGLAY